MTRLVLVPTESLERAWPHVRDRLAEIAATSRGKATAEDLMALCHQEAMRLWVVLDDAGAGLAVALSEIATYPRLKVCRVVGVAGRELERFIHHLAEIEAWARAQGCSAMQHIARKGYARKLADYKLTHVLLERDL